MIAVLLLVLTVLIVWLLEIGDRIDRLEIEIDRLKLDLSRLKAGESWKIETDSTCVSSFKVMNATCVVSWPRE